jgi:spermidine synthase
MWFASFALPPLALFPATAAMGGTLTALDRLTAAIEGAANSSAGVYGANTAGAVAGALVCARSAWPSLVLSPTPSLIRPPNGGAVLATREGPMTTASVVDDAARVRYLASIGHEEVRRRR